MKKTYAKRKNYQILTLFLFFVFLFSNLEHSALAKSSGNIKYNGDNYIINDVKYYIIDQNQLSNEASNSDLYKLLLTTPYRNNTSIVEDWLKLALWTNKVHATGNGPYKVLQEAIYDTNYNVLKGSNSSSGEGKTYFDGSHGYFVRSTGLQVANSITDAEEKMREHAHKVYEETGGKSKWYPPKTFLQNATYQTQQPVLYLMLRAGKNTGVDQQSRGHGPGMGIIFSDFRLKPIFSDPKENTHSNYITNIEELSNKSSSEISYGVINDTNSYVDTTQSLSTTTTVEINSNFPSGTTFSWEEVQNSKNGKNTTTNENHTNDVAIKMPPYTFVQLETETDIQEKNESWNSAVGLQYKVTFVDYSLDTWGNKNSYSTVVASFPNGDIENEPKNACESLAYRYDNKTIINENLNWKKILSYKSNMPNVLSSLCSSVPTIIYPVSIKSIYKTTSQKVSGFKSIYPMTKIISVDNIKSYDLEPGESIYVNEIKLDGLTTKNNSSYHGFDSKKGSWILCNKKGNTLPANSLIANLQKEKENNHIKLIAGRRFGTVYLKYLIDEDFYKTTSYMDGENAPITNETIETCIIPINVDSREPLSDKIINFYIIIFAIIIISTVIRFIISSLENRKLET